jgi:hypothetical protein
VSLVGQRKHNFFGYGIEPLIEDFDSAEDEWDLIEHVRTNGVLDSDTEGSVLGRSSPALSYGGFYNPGYGGPAHKLTYEEWKAKGTKPKPEPEKPEPKDFTEEEKRRHELAAAQSEQGFKNWEKNKEKWERNQAAGNAEWAKIVAKIKAEELQRKADVVEQEREHQRKRVWAEHTSKIERRITQIVDTIDNANANDRTMMRAMLRYMNLGPGMGKRWSAEEFTRFYCQSWRGALIAMMRNDVERCYILLRDRHMT